MNNLNDAQPPAQQSAPTANVPSPPVWPKPPIGAGEPMSADLVAMLPRNIDPETVKMDKAGNLFNKKNGAYVGHFDGIRFRSAPTAEDVDNTEPLDPKTPGVPTGVVDPIVNKNTGDVFAQNHDDSGATHHIGYMNAKGEFVPDRPIGGGDDSAGLPSAPADGGVEIPQEDAENLPRNIAPKTATMDTSGNVFDQDGAYLGHFDGNHGFHRPPTAMDVKNTAPLDPKTTPKLPADAKNPVVVKNTGDVFVDDGEGHTNHIGHLNASGEFVPDPPQT
jgi:hypothetical protein